MATTTRQPRNATHPQRDPNSGLVATADTINPDTGFGDGVTIVEVGVSVRQEPWQNEPTLEVSTSVSATAAQAPADSNGRPMTGYLAYKERWTVRSFDITNPTEAAADIRANLVAAGIEGDWFDRRLEVAVAGHRRQRRMTDSVKSAEKICADHGIGVEQLAMLGRMFDTNGAKDTAEAVEFLAELYRTDRQAFNRLRR